MRLKGWLAAVVVLCASQARGQQLPCLHEDALARAASRLIASEGPATAQTVGSAARAEGSDLVDVEALVVPGEGHKRIRAWLLELRRRSDAMLVCGRAQGLGQTLVLAAARGGALGVGTERRATNGSLRLWGRLAPGFHTPAIVLADSRGELQRFVPEAAELARGFLLPLPLLPAHIQLVATGPVGPRPVAERIVGAARADAGFGAALLFNPLRPFNSPHRSPKLLLAELRERARLPRLRHNRLLAELAARQAERVCREGRVAHELTPGAGPRNRLARARVRARLVGEALARARTPALAFSALARSPSHRMSLSDRRFTDVGVGSAVDAQGRCCLAIVLAAWPRFM
ncbi:MAG: hypothetical protein MJD61_21960 [Proteobacteria bacterium]|nr:hypothetical protein [Pseudomonadota bacterium]